MALDHGYCEVEELRNWNGASATGPVENLERAINAASRSIEKFCDRSFWSTASGVSRDFETCDPWVVEFGAFNDLTAVTAVVTDDAGDGTFETVWSSTDYQLEPVNQTGPETRPWTSMRAVAARRFPRPTATGRTHRTRVTGTWGWSAIPADINQACVLLAARLYRRKDSPEGVTGWPDMGVMRIGRTDPDIVALLDPYRRTAVLVA